MDAPATAPKSGRFEKSSPDDSAPQGWAPFEDSRTPQEKRPEEATPVSANKRSKLSKGHTGRQLGDPEMTEPDSEDDSLFGDAELSAEDLKLLPIEREATKEALTANELLARRLKHAKELYSLYKVEYWGLLEELRTRHKRFVQKQAKGGPDTRTHHEPSERIVGSLREEIRRRKAEHPARGSAGDVKMHDGTGDQPVAAPAQPQGTQPPSADAELAAVQTQRPALKLESGTCQDAAKPVAASPPDRTLPNDFKNPFEPFSTAPIADTTTELPLQIGDEVRGYGSEDDPATFSDMEAIVLEKSGKGGAAAKETMQEWQARYRRQLPHIEHLEQAASASTGRELDRLGAMACLCGRNNRFLIKNSAVSLGRATDVTQVDIDLSSEGDARKVSRQQAHLSLRPDGRFQLKNVGRRTILVNNRQVDLGQVAQLGHLSLVEVGGVRLLFMVNHAAVKRASARTAQLRA